MNNEETPNPYIIFALVLALALAIVAELVKGATL